MARRDDVLIIRLLGVRALVPDDQTGERSATSSAGMEFVPNPQMFGSKSIIICLT